MLQQTAGPIGVNTYFLPCKNKNEVVIVDPGANAEGIISILDRNKLTPVLIALSHGHLDHTSAIPDLLRILEERNIKVPIAIHKNDSHYLGKAGEKTNYEVFNAINANNFFKRFFKPLPDSDFYLSEGDALGTSNFIVLETPGHTLGSICFYSAESNELISGDTLFKMGVGRTDGKDSSENLLFKSIKEKLFTLPENTIVYPGHGGSTTIGEEK